MQNNRLLWLLLVCAGLGALVWLDQRSGAVRGSSAITPAIQAVRPAPAKAAKSPEAKAAPSHTAAPKGREIGNPLAALDKAALRDTVERPLFNPSRRRPPPLPTPPVPAAPVIVRPAPPSYDLLGVVTDGARAVALLRKVGDDASVRVEVGDMISGWRVAKVDARAVRLERDDGTAQTVTLLAD